MPKAAAIALLSLFALPLLAADEPVLPYGITRPGTGYCLSVKGIGFSICQSGASTTNVQRFRNEARAGVQTIGFLAANTYYPPDLVPPAQADRLRELGRKVMEAAPGLAFPELGDSRKGASGWCVCAKDLDGTDLANPYALRGTGGGGCTDWVTCHVDGVPGDPKP